MLINRRVDTPGERITFGFLSVPLILVSPVSHFHRQDSQTCPEKHIRNIMFVVCHTHNTYRAGECIRNIRNPFIILAVFYCQHRCSRESIGGMTRRKGKCGAVRTGSFQRSFQKIYKSQIQELTFNKNYGTVLPVGSGFHACPLKSLYGKKRRKLRIII